MPSPTRSSTQAEAGSYEEFMSRAYAMEREALERYTRFADQLEKAGNREVALVFRSLAKAEGLHARRILTEMGWVEAPALPRAFAWEGNEGPETAPLDSPQESIDPPQALKIALGCEVRARGYFEGIASGNAPARVRAAAAEMALEEREHANMIEYWLSRLPRPLFGWD
jgi:rubrerythrin